MMASNPSKIEAVWTSGCQSNCGLQPENRYRPDHPVAGRLDGPCNPLKTLPSNRPDRPAPKGGANPSGRPPQGRRVRPVKKGRR